MLRSRWRLLIIGWLALALRAGLAGARPDGDVDRVTIGSSTVEPVLLVDGMIDGRCVNDSIYQGTGTFDVGSFTGSRSTCGELAVFSKESAFNLQEVDWTPQRDALTPQLRPRTSVPLSIWVVSNRQAALEWALNDVAHASSLYGDNRAGLVFTVAQSTVVPRGTMTEAEGLIGQGCESVAGLRSKGSPLYEQTMINVYLVEYVYLDRDPVRGATCFDPEEGGADNVIFISLQQHSPVTLAHELGHAFMLRGATGHPDYVDDWQEEGFTWKNIMWSRWEAPQASALDHFTLGQVYRMNVHGGSWLNEAGLRGPATEITKMCSTRPSDQNPCPRLGLDAGGSGK